MNPKAGPSLKEDVLVAISESEADYFMFLSMAFKIPPSLFQGECNHQPVKLNASIDRLGVLNLTTD